MCVLAIMVCVYLSAGVYIYDLVVCVHCIPGGLYVPGMVYLLAILPVGYVYICMCQCVLCGL